MVQDIPGRECIAWLTWQLHVMSGADDIRCYPAAVDGGEVVAFVLLGSESEVVVISSRIGLCEAAVQWVAMLHKRLHKYVVWQGKMFHLTPHKKSTIECGRKIGFKFFQHLSQIQYYSTHMLQILQLIVINWVLTVLKIFTTILKWKSNNLCKNLCFCKLVMPFTEYVFCRL